MKSKKTVQTLKNGFFGPIFLSELAVRPEERSVLDGAGTPRRIEILPAMYYNRPMATIIEVLCPACHASLWVDVETKQVVQHRRSEKKVHSSFEDMLSKEKQKKEAVEERFAQAKSLEQAKKKKAAELFEQNLKEK